MSIRLLATLLLTPVLGLAEFTPRWDDFTTLSGERKQGIIQKYRNGQWSEFIDEATNNDIQDLKDGTSELLLAIGLYKKSFPVLSYAVLATIIETYPTSHLIDQSLEAITAAYQSGKVETGLLQEIFDKRLLKPTSEEALASLHYHRGLTLMEKSFFKWASQEFKAIPKNTYWHLHYDFMGRTKRSEDVQAKKLLELWSDFLERPKLDGHLKQRALLNKARALYELGQFEEAESTYKSVSLSRFDQGTVLRELGWLYYLTSRYKEALGVLNQLKSAVHARYYHTDEYLLAALIYRETCQPELLKGLSDSLEKRLKRIKSDIKRIRAYNSDPQVFQYAIHHPNLKNRARMMTYLNEEGKRATSDFSGEALNLIGMAQKRLQNFTILMINRYLVESNRDAIEELLVLKDEIDYLSYSLKLRRIKETETSYEQKVADARKTSRQDQVVWPVYQEIWEDEILNFQSVLENRCL